jgi:heavy metal translocating P-type ATPase
VSPAVTSEQPAAEKSLPVDRNSGVVATNSKLSHLSGAAFPRQAYSPTASRGPLTRRAWFFSFSRNAFLAILAATGILAHFVIRYFAGADTLASRWPLYVVLLLCGTPLVISLVKNLAAGEFGSDLLAGISILSSVLLGQYLVGCIIVLMLSGGTALEDYATRRASSVLEALAKRMPQIAHRKSGMEIKDISLDEVAVGDVLIIFPHELCPVDGVVVEGHGVMDESYLTGEPYRLSKTPGAKVLSGSINAETALTIQAEKLAVDSRYAKIMEVMRATEQRRPHLRRLGDRLGAWYTPIAVAVAVLTWLVTRDPLRFLAVVVVATPCPLLIAIPVAIIGAISLSARYGIIIKNPAVLEQISNCRSLILDKTGTLTYGKPSLTKILCSPGFQRDDVLRLAASLEQYSRHPLAGAVREAAESAALPMSPVSEMTEKPGQGLEGIVGGKHVKITGRDKTGGKALDLPPVVSGLECLVFLEGAYAATFRFHDAPRQESRSFVDHLGPKHKIDRILLVSGDRKSEVQYLADQVGISEVYAGQSPEQKVAIVGEVTRRAQTMFVGDGINDAPALLAATVGIAFGPNSDITSEAADAVILTTSLQKVDELFHISSRMRSIALQSAVGGMVLSILGMCLAALGYLTALEGAIAQEVIDLAAVLNAVRVALPRGELADMTGQGRRE